MACLQIYEKQLEGVEHMKEYYIHLKYDLNVNTTIKLFIKAYSREQLEDQLGNDYFIIYIKELKDVTKEEIEDETDTDN